MSTKYFILIKSKNNIDNTEYNSIISSNTSLTFILPHNNLDYYTSNGLFEQNLIERSIQWCSKDKLFLDIGAHTGTYSIYLASFVKHVHSFEPQKMTYYALCGSVALSNAKNITCHNIGLGSEDQIGTKKLNIISHDGGGSTLHLKEGDTLLAQEEIVVNTLDSFNLENIGFIKMDVEENEYFVLKGAIETLKKYNPKILFEVNDENKGKNIFDFLRNIGYKIEKINYNMYLAFSDL